MAAFGDDVASGAKALDVGVFKYAEARAGKRLDGRGGILGHHAPMVGILEALAVIPSYLLERQPLVPEPALVVGQTGPERFGVAHLHAVDLNLVPGNKDGRLVRQPTLGAEPLVVEKRAHAVGRRFEHGEGQLLKRDARDHGANQVLRRLLRRLLPERHLAQVGHGYVGPAACLLRLARADGHAAAAARDNTRVGRRLKRPEAGRRIALPQFLGIVLEQLAVHTADVGRRVLDVGTDQRMPVAAMHSLDPRHIHLHQRAAAPLARLEDDAANGLTGQALLLEHSEHAPLRTVQHERHVATRQLVANAHTAPCPKLEIVVASQPLEGRR